MQRSTQAAPEGAPLPRRRLGRTGPECTVLGLGCSRLGSALTRDPSRGAAAVAAALDRGVRLFDTADVYGQGDSERLLGRALRAAGGRAKDAVVCTKAGFLLPAPAWLLRAAKPVLRAATKLRGGVREAASAARAKGYAQSFDEKHLSRALDGSLRRLARERVEVFLLHSPLPEAAADEGVLRFVERAVRDGRVGAFGVSCLGTEADAAAWLGNGAAAGLVSVVQVPMPAGRHAAAPGFLAACRALSVGVIGRELLTAAPAGAARPDLADTLGAALADETVAAVLLGSTSPAHVGENIAALARAWPLRGGDAAPPTPAPARVHGLP